MMGLSLERPWWLLALVLVPIFVAAWWRWRPPIAAAQGRSALILRLGLVILLVLSLAGVQARRAPDRRAVVAVVDLSDSTQSAEADAVAAVRTMQEAKGPDDLFGVVTFGGDALVELPLTREPAFTGFQTQPNGSYSNPDGALKLAANLIPSGYAGQVVLVSDGRQNLGDAAAAVEALEDRAVRVDVVPTGAPPGEEVAVVALEAPGELREGEAATATVRLRTIAPAEGTLTLIVDGSEVERRSVALAPGDVDETFSLASLGPGEHRLSAVVEATPDTFSENDEAQAVVRVTGPPSVLVLEEQTGSAANLTSALEAAGMDTETRLVGQAPTDVAGLTAYDASVVVDVPSAAFPLGAMEALNAANRDLGRGLVALGGPRSYGPGGWGGTPLEEALPVRMEVPQSKERPAVAVVVVIETMESSVGDGVALGAITTMIQSLTPDDELAMVRMGTSLGRGVSTLVLPRARMTEENKAQALETVRATVLGDPAGYAQSLELAFDALAGTEAPNQHVIIAGDGDALADVAGYPELFARAQAQGVIVSSIGIDTHVSTTNMNHMADLAAQGGGRFYLSGTPSQVPGVVLESTRDVLRPWFEQNPFLPEATTLGSLLDGVPLDAFPELGGYVVTTPKPTAEVALASPQGDPVLAGGSNGLGRSVAWTSDAEGRWTSGFLASPTSAALFGRMVAWTLPTGQGEPLRLDVAVQGAGLDVVVNGPAEGGSLEVLALAPGGGTETETLRPTAPGRWEGMVPAGETGTYVVGATLRRDGSVVTSTDRSVPVPYSPEYLEQGRDDGFLASLAPQSGAVLDRPEAAWAQTPIPVTVSSPIFWLLALIAVLLWPVDVALRRLTVSPAKILASVREWSASRRRARKHAVEEEGAAKAAAAMRLRATVESSRSKRESFEPVPVAVSGHLEPESLSRSEEPRAGIRAKESRDKGKAPEPAERAPKIRADRQSNTPEADAADLSSRLLAARRRRQQEG